MYSEVNGRERWHLSRAVPLSIIGMMVVQTILVIIWATRLDSRVGVLEIGKTAFEERYEKEQIQQNNRLLALETLQTRLAVIEDRQNSVLKRLDTNAEKLDQIYKILDGRKN